MPSYIVDSLLIELHLYEFHVIGAMNSNSHNDGKQMISQLNPFSLHLTLLVMKKYEQYQNS